MENFKETIDLAREIAEIPKEKVVLMNRFNPKPFADKLLTGYKFRHDNFKRFWVYNNKEGIWTEDAEQLIKYELRTNLFGETQLKQNYTSEVVSHIKDLTWTREIPEEMSSNLISFKNVLYDLKEQKIIPYSPDYFITTKINLELDENFKECPKIDAFFKTLVGQNSSILYDLIAYCLYRDYPYQKMFILHGSGENGKSTYLDLLNYCIGMNNISSETPQELSSKDFSKGLLWQKYANISSELPYRALTDTNTIKGLCGGDKIKCNRKFKEPFQFRSYAKLIFAGNELPATTDKTHAFARRLYIIKFDNKIANPDRCFMKKLLLDQAELKGLAWKCLERLKEQEKRGWTFEIDVDAEKMLNLYEELSNPLSKFLKETTIMDSEGFIFKYEFKQLFESWCKKYGFRIWNDTEIGQYLKNIYEGGKKTILDSNGNQKRYNAWLGLRWL